MDTDMTIPLDARIRYLERRKKDIEALHLALASKDLAEFKRVGHQLRGNAASFDYPDLEKVAIQMEVASDAHDLAEASHQLQLFEQWLAKASSQMA